MDENMEIEKHITDRFNVQQVLGKGAYGIVWKCEDKENGNQVIALKKNFQCFSKCYRCPKDFQRNHLSPGVK